LFLYPLHADDFQLITPDGSEYDKQQYLGQIESGVLDYKIWDADTIRVRMYDNVAVLRYKDKDFQVYIDGELAKSGILKHTNLYEKRNGQWQIVWSHASGGTEPDSYNDITNPEGASLKWVIEFKSPDMFLETVTETNKPVRTITYTRVK
jgi:hypothetical protein